MKITINFVLFVKNPSAQYSAVESVIDLSIKNAFKPLTINQDQYLRLIKLMKSQCNLKNGKIQNYMTLSASTANRKYIDSLALFVLKKETIIKRRVIIKQRNQN